MLYGNFVDNEINENKNIWGDKLKKLIHVSSITEPKDRKYYHLHK
jgi:hypothetical protein